MEPTHTYLCVGKCLCTWVFTFLSEYVKLWGFDRMSLSDCMYACMHRQHCVLPTANLPTVSSPWVPGGWVRWVNYNMWHGFPWQFGVACVPTPLHSGTTLQLTLLRVELFEGFVKHIVCLNKTKVQCGRVGEGKREVKQWGGRDERRMGTRMVEREEEKGERV